MCVYVYDIWYAYDIYIYVCVWYSQADVALSGRIRCSAFAEAQPTNWGGINHPAWFEIRIRPIFINIGAGLLMFMKLGLAQNNTKQLFRREFEWSWCMLLRS